MIRDSTLISLPNGLTLRQDRPQDISVEGFCLRSHNFNAKTYSYPANSSARMCSSGMPEPTSI